MNGADKVVEFLNDAKMFYIATTDGDQPRVRPFGTSLNIDGKLSIGIGGFKNVYKQILANPKVEISATLADGKWIRVTGSLINTTTDVNRQKFFDIIPPMIAKRYSGEKRKEFSIFSFKSATAVIEDFAGNKETFELK